MVQLHTIRRTKEFPFLAYEGTTSSGASLSAGQPIGLLLSLTYDGSLMSGDTNTHDFNSDYGYNATRGFFINDGAGDLNFTYSSDGTNYSSEILMKSGENFDLEDVIINTIKVMYVASTAASYRIYLV